MSNSTIPDTNTLDVAALAVAWEVVKLLYRFADLEGTQDEKCEAVIKEVIKLQKAIVTKSVIF